MEHGTCHYWSKWKLKREFGEMGKGWGMRKSPRTEMLAILYTKSKRNVDGIHRALIGWLYREAPGRSRSVHRSLKTPPSVPAFERAALIPTSHPLFLNQFPTTTLPDAFPVSFSSFTSKPHIHLQSFLKWLLRKQPLPSQRPALRPPLNMPAIKVCSY
jgi:hypothetical protein